MEEQKTWTIVQERQLLLNLAADAQPDYATPIVAAIVNGRIRDLQDYGVKGDEISFIEENTPTGWNIYQRSVLFLLITAISELYPGVEVTAKFTANKGLFCEVAGKDWILDGGRTKRIAKAMKRIAREDRVIRKQSLTREAAVKLFEQEHQNAKASLIASLSQKQVSIYSCGGCKDYLYGAMVPRSGLLEEFAVDYEAPGLLIRTPDMTTGGKVHPLVRQPKLSHMLAESKEWAHILHCSYVSDLNRLNREGKIDEVIRVSEALQEKHIARIADYVAAHRDRIRLVLIAGPSSSGKTSFAQRLRVQIRTNGLVPVSISLDDYFKNREDTPKTPEGKYDYESLRALDTDLFNQNMLDLMNGKEVQLPTYNFVTGEREWDDKKKIVLGAGQPVIVEGIHGLNEELSASIPRDKKLKIYISALAQLNIDAHNRVPTTDARLLRRLVRDKQFRDSSAEKTLLQWPDVRAGEERNIFPYQEDADVMFNSALIYEIGVLKRYARPILEEVKADSPAYTEAQRLLDFFQYFDDITAEDDIPNNSLLREFIGHSVFFKEQW